MLVSKHKLINVSANKCKSHSKCCVVYLDDERKIEINKLKDTRQNVQKCHKPFHLKLYFDFHIRPIAD